MSEFKISCPHCEQHIMLDDAWAGRTVNCPSCGKPIEVPGQAPEPLVVAQPAPAPQSPGLRINRLQASSAPPPLPTQPAPTRHASMRGPGVATASRTSGLAIASLILSILGCFGISAIAAVICGHMARKRMRNDPSLTGGGLALAGLIIGYLMIAFTAVWGTMFAIGVAQGVNEARRIAQQQRGRGYERSGPAVPGSDWTPMESPTKAAPPRPAEAVSGSINGDPFTYAKSSLSTNMSLLSISDGEEFIPDREVKIFLFPKPGESLENRTWNIKATSSGMNPHVHLRWEEAGKSKTTAMTSGYELQLQTGAIKDGVITGSLNLKIAGKASAELKGNFAAVVE